MGHIIVIEGADGAGKATQTKLLVEALKEKNIPVATLDFPRYYDNYFGGQIARGLRGEFGPWTKHDPHMVSIWYAADRWESSQRIRDWVSEGKTVILDRHTTANMIHQGGKIANPDKRAEFIKWLEHLEYEAFGVPRPDQVVYLDLPTKTASQNLAGKDEAYKQGQTDLTETDQEYAHNARQAALWLVDRDPTWTMVDCSDGDAMRTREDIHQEIMRLIGM